MIEKKTVIKLYLKFSEIKYDAKENLIEKKNTV